MDTANVQTLKNIVKGVIFENGYDTGMYTYVYQQVINALREIHMYHTTKYKVVKVDVDIQTNTIEWPDDYLGLVFLGIPSNGRIWTLTRDDKLITTTTLVDGQETLDSTVGEGVVVEADLAWGYQAKGGQNSFYYTEDENNRRFVINGTNPANIILGYISSGVEDKDTLVPLKYKDCIHFYVRWRMNLREPVNKVNADYFKKEYEEAVNKLKAFEDPTLDEIYDAILKSSIQTIIR